MPVDVGASEVDPNEVGPNEVDRAILSRRSTRGYLPRAVPPEVIDQLLRVAGRAPSGSNIQPWHVHVVTGKSLVGLTRDMVAAHEAGEAERPEYQYYPKHWRAPYVERRRATGWGLYELAGVARGDREGAARQRGLNYTFFGAPVGLVFAIDADMEQGSWLDYGMFLQSIMVAARGHGLDTCPQAAIGNFPEVVRRHLGIPMTQTLVCGMALGYADPDAPTNRLVTAREPLDTFVTRHC